MTTQKQKKKTTHNPKGAGRPTILKGGHHRKAIMVGRKTHKALLAFQRRFGRDGKPLGVSEAGRMLLNYALFSPERGIPRDDRRARQYLKRCRDSPGHSAPSK